MKLEKGTTISHYKILSKIGKGGMGEVYLAEDTKLDRKVAVKFLNDEFSKDADKLNRFVQEAKAASALNHPNILTVYEIGENDGTNYIATEFIDGKDLTHHISEDKILLETILDISIQIVSALKTAHEAGIVHRDIKPDNLMVRGDGIVKVLDFGLAKLTEKQSDENLDLEAATIAKVDTVPGVVMGTPNYMSPEQARGKDIDHQTDIFSFGIVLYEMLTRKLPFAGETVSDIIASILTKEPKPLDELNESVPDDLREIVGKTLEKDKSRRYQQADELLEDLKRLKKRVELDEELERTILPQSDGQKTQILNATTVGDDAQTTGNNSRVSVSVEKSSLNKMLMAVAGIVVIAAIGLGYWFYSGNNSKQIESIAVMPFVNDSGDEDVEYLSDGMTETLISSLSNIPNLSVKARSTVFYYKGKNKSAREIGEELKVDAVLLGRINQKGEGLKISLELVDVESLDAVWSRSYDRKMSDLVTLQSEIARNVSENLQLKLSAADQEKVTKTNTTNAEAQKLYLKGRFHWNKRKIKDFEKAEEYFKQAIEKDPNYALAYSGLADTYNFIPLYGNFRSKDYYPRAKQAAQKALALDDDLAEAHASLGNVFWGYEHDWANAEKEYKRAIELNPNYASAYQWYSELLQTLGEHDRAMKEMETALKLDPFSRVINRNVGYAFYTARKYDEAIVQLKKSNELFPDDPWGRIHLCDAYAAKGNYDLAVAEFITYLKLDGKSSETINKYEEAYKKDGWKGFWLAQLNDQLAVEAETLAKNKSAYIPYWRIAQTYATIGNKDKAIEYLRSAIDELQPDVLYIPNIHYYDPMRDDPRFVELMKKVGFPQFK